MVFRTTTKAETVSDSEHETPVQKVNGTSKDDNNIPNTPDKMSLVSSLWITLTFVKLAYKQSQDYALRFSNTLYVITKLVALFDEYCIVFLSFA